VRALLDAEGAGAPTDAEFPKENPVDDFSPAVAPPKEKPWLPIEPSNAGVFSDFAAEV